LALCAPWLAAAADAPPVLKIHQHSLANGLKIVLAKDSSRPVVNLQVWYHVGSKDEKTGRTGFAHLFEHMMFRGSRNLGPEEHMRLVREAGGEVNAYTTFDATVYWETFPANYLEQMIWLEADRMASLVINEENFKKEREVVKEERRMRVDNPPYGKLMEDVLASAFQRYPYKNSPIGTMDDLNKATVADVKEFHDTFYVPNNATVVAVGDFEVEEALVLIRKHFTPIPRGKSAVPRVTATEPAQAKFAEVNKAYDNAPLEGVVSAWKLPPGNHPDRYALEIASQILSSGQSSRLYRRLVYDEQAAVAAFGEGMFLEGPSLFFGAAIANQGKNIKEVSSSFQFVIEQMRKEPVTAEELDKARNQLLAGFITGKETMQSKADLLGSMAVLRGDAERYNTEIENYRKVTAGDVQRVVQKYLTASNETRLWVKPEVKK
jgi:zinc protease